MHAEPLVQCDLRGKVRTRAEAIDAKSTTGWNLGAAQRAVADDACAQKGRGVLVVETVAQRVRVSLVDQAGVGVSTVAIPSGERRVQTEVFLTAPAEVAGAVGQSQPRHANAITHPKPAHSRAECLDPSHDLVPRNYAGSPRWQVTLGKMQVGATDATADDCDAKLPGSRFRIRPLDQSEWMLVDWAGVIDGPGPHKLILHPVEASFWRVNRQTPRS